MTRHDLLKAIKQEENIKQRDPPICFFKIRGTVKSKNTLMCKRNLQT